MFVGENEDDELVQGDVSDLKILAEELRKNFIIIEGKVKSIVENKEGKNLLLDNKKITKKEILEIETYRFLNKYGYDLSAKTYNEEPKYQDRYMWSKEELDILKRYYIQGGSKLCQEKGLKRSSRAITSKANEIGLHIRTEEWSDFELNILKQYYPIGGVDLCIEKGIVNRGRKAIVQQANRMNLVVRILWSPIEEKIIKEYYQIGGYKLCQEKGLQHRSKSQILNKAFLLGINKVKKNEGWSKKELDLLSKYYPLGGVRLCIEKGLNRSLSSIRCKANKEGLKYMVDNTNSMERYSSLKERILDIVSDDKISEE